MTGVTIPVAAPEQVVARRTIALSLTRRRGSIVVALLIFAVAVAHGYNMLHYPYLTDDEGTYFSQGWAVFHLGRLAPYTYIYDHAPLGWIQIAIWQVVSDGIRFGYGLASGRVLMLLFQAASALLVVGIGRRATGKLWVGILAAALMSFLPFGLYYQRRILLDNIATFWILLSIFAVSKSGTLRSVWLSAAAIAVAILSKEVALAAYPAVLYLVVRNAPSEARRLAISGWVVLSLSICSTYIVLALLKGELFPAGTFLGGSHAHVSLICTAIWQATRTDLSGAASFSVALSSWSHSEPLLVIGGSGCAAYLITVCRKRPAAAAIGWAALLLWLFILRNAVVFAYYLLPLVPLLALCMALTVESIVGSVRRWANSPRAASALVLGVILIAIGAGAALDWGRAGTGLFTRDPIAGQLAAERWIEHNLPRSSRMVIDMSMWQDLQVPSSGKPFRYAEYDWKAGDDPAVRDRVFFDSWRDVNYVITTPSLIADTEANDFAVVAGALEHSYLIRTFNSGGWPIEIRKVNPYAVLPIFTVQGAASKPVAPTPKCMDYGGNV